MLVSVHLYTYTSIDLNVCIYIPKHLDIYVLHLYLYISVNLYKPFCLYTYTPINLEMYI